MTGRPVGGRCWWRVRVEHAGLSPDHRLDALRPFLAVRILGVIPPHSLTSADPLLVLVELAEAQQLLDSTQFAPEGV